jgi:hypothetical protein
LKVLQYPPQHLANLICCIELTSTFSWQDGHQLIPPVQIAENDVASYDGSNDVLIVVKLSVKPKSFYAASHNMTTNTQGI